MAREDGEIRTTDEALEYIASDRAALAAGPARSSARRERNIKRAIPQFREQTPRKHPCNYSLVLGAD